MIDVRACLSVMLTAVTVIGCDDARRAHVDLTAAVDSTTPDARLRLQAHVSGTPAGTAIEYRWSASTGIVDPRVSRAPVALFTFADGMVQDRISVELVREGKVVGRGDLDVKQRMEAPADGGRAAAVTMIEITQVPPYDPLGGPDTRADIGGKISGKFSPLDRVVVYARANTWYRQPLAESSHPVQRDSTWSAWTHTGSTYAVLLVRRDAQLPAMTDVLPLVGGPVIARTVVTGLGR